MSRLIVTDSSGVERAINRLVVTDSGGVERDIARLFVVDSGGTSRLVFVGVVITLTGALDIEHTTGAPISPSAGLEIRADGTVWKTQFNGSIETQLSPATDWIIPRNTADQYQVRFTNLVGSGPQNSTVPINVWHPLSLGDFVMEYERFTNGSHSGTFNIEVRKGTGAVAGSGTYKITVTRNP